MKEHTVELQWLEHLWDHVISLRQKYKFESVRVDNSARSGGVIRISLIVYKNEGMLCVLIRIASLRHTIYRF